MEAGEPPLLAEQKMIDFLRGADVVTYDTMYDLSEYLEKMTWGHSYPDYAYAVCRAAGVHHLVLFHHSPDRTDDELDAQVIAWADRREPTVSLVVVAESGEVGGQDVVGQGDAVAGAAHPGVLEFC